ncbi:sodium:solute symporter family protein [Streptomyces endophyticus]|uniref:Sodium:solute symporter family protein n=1 Tax=Streptomyces endophyticus TaxID=714166 RepID=A0ABU6F8A7_9ACTN|nr:sodium:solute symporter family protein [Streptomyces endophyticus]MEB8340269.1 sodium:solute symporter family protein [Streptomyces endophyticus]
MTLLIVVFVGIAALAAVGFLGRRAPAKDLGEWASGGGRMSTLTMWFLQAGEIFTTFSFLGLGALVFSAGVAALYVPVYLVVGYVVVFFTAPAIWRIGRSRGHLTNADFLGDRFASRGLGKTAAVVGIIFQLPYLQLQITGLGLLVEIASDGRTSGTGAMVFAVCLVLAFVLWAGLRGIARVAYVKDGLMLTVLLALAILVPAHELGGPGGLFTSVREAAPELLTIHAGPENQTWFITAVLCSAIGSGCATLPYVWPSMFAAGSPRILRHNSAMLPLFTVALVLPMVVGFVALIRLDGGADGNTVLLEMAGRALPDWLLGVVVVGGIATAMVPSAAMILSLSSLVAKNLIPARTAKGSLAVNHLTATVICAATLLLAVLRPDALADLLLLTFSGLVQLAPGNLLGLLKQRPCDGSWVLGAMLAGVAVVAAITFAPVDTGGFNEGLIGLAVNLVILGIGCAVQRGRGPQDVPAEVLSPAPEGTNAR